MSSDSGAGFAAFLAFLFFGRRNKIKGRRSCLFPAEHLTDEKGSFRHHILQISQVAGLWDKIAHDNISWLFHDKGVVIY